MESAGEGIKSLCNCLKASKIRNIDGKILGKDGKPMIATRQVQFGMEKQNSNVDSQSLNERDDSHASGGWTDDNVNAMKTAENDVNDDQFWSQNKNLSSPTRSFANVVSGATSGSTSLIINFCTMVNPEKVENSDFVLPVDVVNAVQNRFANSLVGFFVGKAVAFPLVKNYVTNTWAKFGFQKIMRDEDGFFYFKFASLTGLEQVLEQGPWLIWNTLIILNKWTPDVDFYTL
ncbi:retrovirus-related pol polyprotein from transposon TNT 1-94 [Tanacetum coccineum]